MPRCPRTPFRFRPPSRLGPALLLAVAVTVPTPPPAEAQSSSAAARAAVSADSAGILDALGWLAHDDRGGRAPGTPGGEAARHFVLAAFQDAGVRPFEGRYRGFYERPVGMGHDRAVAANVVGWLPGTDPDLPWIVVTAHFDHMGTRSGVIYNGADDNASGTAALLFLARRLAEHPLRHPVILAALDAEESGLRGARAFVRDPPVPLEEVALNLNMDMLARTGGTLWAAGAHHTPALRPVLDAVAREAPLELRQGHDRPGVPGEDDWTSSSDHAPFHEAGIPFVYLGVEDHPDYHRHTDDVERIDPSEYLDAVATALLVLEGVDRALPLDGRAGGEGGGP